jgi:hypothetical protein
VQFSEIPHRFVVVQGNFEINIDLTISSVVAACNAPKDLNCIEASVRLGPGIARFEHKAL